MSWQTKALNNVIRADLGKRFCNLRIRPKENPIILVLHSGTLKADAEKYFQEWLIILINLIENISNRSWEQLKSRVCLSTAEYDGKVCRLKHQVRKPCDDLVDNFDFPI